MAPIQKGSHKIQGCPRVLSKSIPVINDVIHTGGASHTPCPDELSLRKYQLFRNQGSFQHSQQQPVEKKCNCADRLEKRLQWREERHAIGFTGVDYEARDTMQVQAGSVLFSKFNCKTRVSQVPTTTLWPLPYGTGSWAAR
ncbi:uncharacterized protein LOC113214744 isoform X3 [Frankliniella occidentalis]|uniref:Uncharacterized protein LOC113214744 isoform X3 n=1 Tax=Frankliniella occidentalis TaxID=133901 RepID=A0A9C6XRH3_FRAOC|nr:uncharacterized protein LOC113214744 isoform X3 [Frankliniella occidentalis]